MSTPAPASSYRPRMRCTVYVDAFNWHYGVLIHHPEWQSLNLQSFFEALRIDDDVVGIRFFTAIVHPDQHVSAKRDRQRRYLAALGSLSKVEVVLGKYPRGASPGGWSPS